MSRRRNYYLGVAALSVLVAACSQTHSGGLVRNGAYAATLAKHKCGAGKEFFSSWSAKLDGDIWKVSFGSSSGARFSVNVNANTAVAGPCLAGTA